MPKYKKALKSLKREGIGPHRVYFNEFNINNYYVRNYGLKTLLDYDRAHFNLQHKFALEDTQFPTRISQFESGYPWYGYAHSYWVRYLTSPNSYDCSVISTVPFTLTDSLSVFDEWFTTHLPHKTTMDFESFESFSNIKGCRRVSFSNHFPEHILSKYPSADYLVESMREFSYNLEHSVKTNFLNVNPFSVPGVYISHIDNASDEPHYIFSCSHALSRISIHNLPRDISRMHNSPENQTFLEEYNLLESEINSWIISQLDSHFETLI